MNTALTEWTSDRRSHIQLARNIAHACPGNTAALHVAADLALVSHLRVCRSEFQAFRSALSLEAVEATRSHLDQTGATGLSRVGRRWA